MARRGMFSNARSANSPRRRSPEIRPAPDAIASPGKDESSVGDGFVDQPLDLLICFTFESVFSIEGVGLLAWNAVRMQDQATVMTVVLLASSVTLVGMLASDAMHRWIDPRVRLAT